MLTARGVGLPWAAAPRPALLATIECPRGTVVLTWGSPVPPVRRRPDSPLTARSAHGEALGPRAQRPPRSDSPLSTIHQSRPYTGRMRVLIVSDIHANLAAIEAVLRDARAGGALDAVWSLGDCVGYGPEPRECMSRRRTSG